MRHIAVSTASGAVVARLRADGVATVVSEHRTFDSAEAYARRMERLQQAQATLSKIQAAAARERQGTRRAVRQFEADPWA